MNELTNAKWYTIEELAELCGISVKTLKKGDSPLLTLSIDFKVESRLGGYHNTQKFYSENVLKALKEYQIKNSVNNATKNKEIAIQGNVSFIQNQTVKQTIKTMPLEEIANILGYSSEYLRKKCTELGFTKNGQKTYLTENQVTELKSILVPRTSDMKIRGENATTNLEILENYKKANDDLPILTEKTMTTKELSDVLNVDVSTITKTVKRLNETSEVLPKFKQGQTPRFTEKQATIIKNEIAKHHNLESRQIDNVSTDYEMELMTQKVLAYHIQKANEYKQRAEIAEKSLNRIADGRGCFTFNQAAKALKLPYGNKTLFKKLKELGILNQDNSPNQSQTNSGNFKVVVKFINDDVGNKNVTLITSKGLVYLAKKFNTTIDESVKADA